MNASRRHWERVYQSGDRERVGWHQPNPATSLEMLRACALDRRAPIIDIGGGSSRLVDRLLVGGHTDVTVLDISVSALEVARERLGERAPLVQWIEGDVTSHEFDRVYSLWHDRAAFHFLVDKTRQDLYVEQMGSAVAAGGYVILATFALDGPERCSGLPVQRYDGASLSSRLGAAFAPIEFRNKMHVTPMKVKQSFLFARFRRVP